MRDTLRIEFYRADRTYRSGEPVRGELVIHTDHGEACGSIHLRRFWRTHGRGNSDQGGRGAMLLHEGPLQGPPPYRVPFEFEAPGGPFTYHGSLLNVDHYVEARVDIPGLFDPGSPEEFVLVPGTEVDPPPPELLKATRGKASSGRGCRVMIGALLVLFGFFTLPFGLILMIPGLFLAFPMLWRALAGAKIGEVSSGTAEMIVPPGRAVRIRVALEPKKAREINEARAVLRGREIVVSGTGSDRRVHIHEIHSREVTLSGPRRLPAGRKATLEAELEVPDDGAYSFESKHNEVVWDVRVSVDIPTWPDWHQEHKVVVWAPSSGEAEAPALRKPSAPTARLRDRRDVPEGGERPRKTIPRTSAPERGPVIPHKDVEPPETVPAEAPPDASPGEASPAAGSATAPSTPALAEAVRAILEKKSFGGGRDPLIRRLVGARFTFDLEVDLVKHTFGAGPDPVYRHGRTVTGAVAGTEIPVEVRFPVGRNEEIDRYRRGAVHTVTATVVDWEKLSEKPVLEA